MPARDQTTIPVGQRSIILASTPGAGPYGWRRALARPIPTALGLLLISAAGLKLYGLNVSPFAQYGRLLTPSIQSVAIIWEIILGVWLLTGTNRFFAWLTTTATFAVFAGVSGYLGVIGQASCGCFGMIEASPWAAFAVDAVALLALAACRPTAYES